MGPSIRGPGLLLATVALSWLGAARAQGTCPPPERLDYAELEKPEVSGTTEGFPIGTTVSYVCRPGYMKILGKSSSRTCSEDLQWVPKEQFCTAKKCNHPEQLLHGSVHVTSLEFGSEATFSCAEGYRLVGPDRISCEIRGNGVGWSRDLPVCEAIACKPPPSIPHGSYTEAENYVYQTAVTYTCDRPPAGDEPFSLIGPPSIFCTFDEHLNGVWSEAPPQCKVVKCDNPRVENAKKIFGSGFSYRYGDSVTFECDPGYFMTGSETITCGEDNTWSSKPVCEKSTCPPPERLDYAELEKPEVSGTTEGFPIGTTVSYVCRPGYMKILGKSSSRTCSEDLQWVPKEQFCTAKKCNHPEQLLHGSVHVTSLEFGSEATFSCAEGYRLVGPDRISCEIRGNGVGWSRDLPVCEAIACKPPPSIPHGSYTEAENYVYQTAVTYTCDRPPAGDEPFSLIGPPSIFCTFDEHLNGVWSEAPPQCKVVKCDNPRVENAKKIFGSGFSYRYGDSVTFECDPGYFMTGSETITCGEDNTWSSKPVCEKITAVACSAPKIKNGAVVQQKSVYQEGESVQIQCNANCAFPDGARNMTVTCQGHDTWSSLQHCTCEIKASDSTPSINHGRVIEGQKPSYSVGDFIKIECYTGYTLHGEARIEYVGENRWNPEVPTCQLSGYITACICVIVAIVVLLAAFWIYKKFFSQNGKRDSTPYTAEYKTCKA
ncbi:PREDICTED: C4b-binding protein alpha chain-like [Calidris pugnax]|uniref:C4b-binding protein alpha chain-like n=1 Tax=Calidris pugnax TaxID=198806 RepID=UPI00071D5BEF|nr:PREDICTED: C4b-binding protein alpha chain-like [Calidris pugnax]